MSSQEEPFYGQNLKEAYSTMKEMIKGVNKMKCALVIGHKASSQGACNQKHGICEYEFNEQLACDVYDELEDKGSEINVRIIKRRSYKELPDDINIIGPDFFISMHCNAAAEGYTGKWNGTETLYYYKSKRSENIAEIVQRKMLDAFGFRDRGILPRATEDRGGTLLRYTNMPGVIAEPFFIDNDSVYETIMNNYDKLVRAYVDSIESIAKVI